jgi:prophage tail gpP-like protein
MSNLGMPLERVSLVVGGRVFEGWTSVTMSASAQEATRQATFQCALPPLERIAEFFLRPDMPATILVSGELWGTGYIGDISPDHDDESGSISVEWLSKTIDAVESSIDHPTGFAEKKTILEIAREFESSDVEWASDAKMEPEPDFSVIPGESSFQAVERRVRAKGLLIYDDPEGKAVIAGKPEGRHAGGLALGVNIRAGSSKLSGKGRHNPVIVRGQSAKGHGAGALRIEARAKDASVGRLRPKVIIQEGEATAAGAKKRAEWQVARAAGRSREASITVAGWRAQGGKLWTRNWLVSLDDPLLFLRQDMVIKSVTFTQGPGEDGDGAATQAVLSLADPRALGGDKSQGTSDGSWATPDEEAEVTAR